MAATRVALITGGARGIGWAIATEFLSRQWNVAIADVDAAALQSRCAGAHDGLLGLTADVRDERSVADLFQHTYDRFGRLDAFVNNAGVAQWTALAGIDWTAWTKVLAVNLEGAVRCLSEAGRRMIASGIRGSIVNIGSVGAERGIRFRGPYTAAKAALQALTRTAAIEWAEYGIRVNSVAPGYVATELVGKLSEAGQLDLAQLVRSIPLGRLAEPAEIAKAVRFLASDEASYITGQTLFVDGGFLAGSALPGTMTPNARVEG
jgi:NAD(P)-dependent dehydrogenase (short-subunit alcohol dehydrogenase family)